MTRRLSLLPLAFLVASLAFVSMASITAASAHTTFTTSLNGAEERPGPGDPNGKGFVSLDIYPNGNRATRARSRPSAERSRAPTST